MWRRARSIDCWFVFSLLLVGCVRTVAASDGCCAGATLADRYELIPIDTLLYIDNRGLERLFVDLNGHAFKLVTNEDELHRSGNAFLIPRFGEITLHIGRYIHSGEGNYMEVASQGPEGATADLIIADLLLPGQEVAYAIDGVRPLPEAFGLLRSFPNPFRDRAHITFEIPSERIAGVHVRMVLFDAAGRRVRTLLDDVRYPGEFALEWDGTDAGGRPAASGVYLCQLSADGFRQTIRLVRVN